MTAGEVDESWYLHFDRRLWLSDAGDGEADANFLMHALALHPGDRALDAPCGDGRVLAPLARRGVRMTGVDLDGGFLERARARLAGDLLEAELIALDMRRISFDARYDAAFCWWGSFGYFSEEENVGFVRNLAHAVKPGGRVLIDQPNRSRLLIGLEPVQQRRAIVDGRIVGRIRAEMAWDAERRRIDATWSLRPRKGGRVACRFSIRIYGRDEMDELLRAAGLGGVTYYGDRNGRGHAEDTPRLIAVGRRGTG